MGGGDPRQVERIRAAAFLADVPVGAFLSGGSTRASSSPVLRNALPDRSIRSPSGSGGGFQRVAFRTPVAERFGTRHTEEIVTPDACHLLDELVHHYDEPFADASAVPTYLVSRLASRSVKVVLSGDGGDEAFAGYARYAHDLFEPGSQLPAGLAAPPGSRPPRAGVWPKADWLPGPLRAKTLLTNLSLEPAAAYANTLALCRPPLRRCLLARDIAAMLSEQQPEDAVRAAYESAPTCDPLSGMIAADVASVLPDDFLVKTDLASMAQAWRCVFRFWITNFWNSRHGFPHAARFTVVKANGYSSKLFADNCRLKLLLPQARL